MLTEGEMREDRGYRVCGRVQGVGFRWWARGVAEELAIGGTVRNLADGSVEVRATGDAANLDQLEGMLRVGPRFSRVDRLEVIEVEPMARPDEFRIEP